ncbi:hypothetical protein CVV43_04560 [Candidatus Saccharibacteria bacterium HGW-Saccharibacteria-1]|jgi:Zn ribbon nucleic-acid-binding protein|nr:MAG: hypothetical protein CVV43_04560 [Candidatus Saccharibacteria bacterium HGW-Saccharibacteria-1]
MNTAGCITSTPDAYGKHRLKCPKCQTEFTEYIVKDSETDELQNITCTACRHSDAPLIFIHEANKEIADKIAMDYAKQEISNDLRKSFRGSKNVKFR